MREQRPAARILIADDHQLLAHACKSLLEPELAVVGIVAGKPRRVLPPPIIAKDHVTFLLSRRTAQFTDQKRITKRQCEILQLLAEGLSMKQVASVIDIKPGTVAFHKYRMMERLDIHTNAELLRYALKHQMISQ